MPSTRLTKRGKFFPTRLWYTIFNTFPGTTAFELQKKVKIKLAKYTEPMDALSNRAIFSNIDHVPSDSDVTELY